MQVVSPAFENSQVIPPQYTCRGDDVNPPLAFVDVPENAKSLVLIVDDPDAVGGLFVHWLVFNIPASVSHVAEKSVPSGVEGMTSWGKSGYGGPCPPSGTHRYFFKLYALDTLLALTESADKKAVEQAMSGHILDHAELIGLVSN